MAGPYTRPTASDPGTGGGPTDATVIIDALSDGLEAVEAALPGKASTSHDHAGTYDPAGSAAAAQDAAIAASQPLDSDLTAIAALSTTSYGRAFLTLADAAAARAAAGLGNAATLNVGTSAGTVAAGDDSRFTDRSFLPATIMVPAVVAPSATSGAWTQAYTAGQMFGVAASGPNTQNAYIEWPVSLAPGTYTLRFIHSKNTNMGIATVSLNGSSVGTIDCYAGSSTSNNVTDLTGITVAGGTTLVRFTAATKNASSSGYVLFFPGFSLTRTGA